MARNLEKEDLYEAVKTLIDSTHKHIHLPQQKLFTLFSVAFQYMLFESTRNPGTYLIRIEDRQLADKLARKAKDESTRKFLGKMLLPRRLKYEKSNFHLDFFQFSSWSQTNELSTERLRTALVVRNTISKPMSLFEEEEEESPDGPSCNVNELPAPLAHLGEHYYLTSLTEIVPQTITIGFNPELEQQSEISFPFIKEAEEQALAGVKIASDFTFKE